MPFRWRVISTRREARHGSEPLPPEEPIIDGFPRTPRTPVAGLYLASAFGGEHGFNGAILSGAEAARLAAANLELGLGDRRCFDRSPAEPYSPVGVIGSSGGSRGEPNGSATKIWAPRAGWRELVHVLSAGSAALTLRTIFFTGHGVDAFHANFNARCGGKRTCRQGLARTAIRIPNCFSAKSKRRAKAVVALSFAALCAVGLSGGGARAGFLEDLFGAFSGEQRAAPSRDAYSERRVRRQASSLSYIPRQRRKAAHPPSDGMATAVPRPAAFATPRASMRPI